MISSSTANTELAINDDLILQAKVRCLAYQVYLQIIIASKQKDLKKQDKQKLMESIKKFLEEYE